MWNHLRLVLLVILPLEAGKALLVILLSEAEKVLLVILLSEAEKALLAIRLSKAEKIQCSTLMVSLLMSHHNRYCFR